MAFKGLPGLVCPHSEQILGSHERDPYHVTGGWPFPSTPVGGKGSGGLLPSSHSWGALNPGEGVMGTLEVTSWEERMGRCR